MEDENQKKRQTAYIVDIKSIMTAKVEKGEKFSNFKIENLPVFRVNVLGTIVRKYEPPTGTFVFLTLDDGSETISAKLFNEDKKMAENIEAGDLVLVIGKIREYNDEVYLQPELLKKVEDKNEFIYRKLKILESKKMIFELGKEYFEENEGKQEELTANVIETPKTIIINFIKQSQSGVSIDDIISKTNFDKEIVKDTVNDLMRDGEIFEHKPGFVKTI